MRDKELPNRLPTPVEMETGRVEISNGPFCPVCGHGDACHQAGYCRLCKTECESYGVR